MAKEHTFGMSLSTSVSRDQTVLRSQPEGDLLEVILALQIALIAVMRACPI